MKIDVKNLRGESAGTVELDPAVFEVKINEVLLHQIYVSQHANRRQGTVHTKDKGERAGSTRKPWKQKGTGRARTGSIRNPIWRGGGVTFGPRKNRNFKQKINKKENQLAVKMVLSGKVQDKELVIVDDYKTENSKTKEMAVALKNLGVEKKTLMAFNKDESQNALVSRNLPNVENILVDQLNVFDMLNRKFLILSKKGVEQLNAKYGKKNLKTTD